MQNSISGQPGLSVNARAARLLDNMLADSAALGIAARRGTLGQLLIDAGVEARGGVEAGLRIGEICMGGLGKVALVPWQGASAWRWALAVSSSHPVTACLASQYAGWNLSHGEGEGAYNVLGSGPGRAIARKEKLFEELGYKDEAGRAIFVLEAPTPPPDALVEQIADDCNLAPKDLAFIYAPTESIAGTTQVVARVLEVALHKAHELHFPLAHIVDGLASAPLPPAGGDFMTAMGRTNDAIIYGGHVHLSVTGAEAEAADLAARLPSAGSRDYGRSFKEIFAAVNYDFYAIDPALFSPASVTVTAVETGKSFHGGRIDEALVDASFA
jgi:methenyltetrahydromethanopterin cyclohydrolase